MMETERVIAANEAYWDKAADRGVGSTIPWLDLNPGMLREFAKGRLCQPPGLLARRATLPGIPLADLEGRDVLCLGAGGGQQSAVFALLGARVTVVDLSQRQLQGGRQAAAHYGYAVKTIHADMQDLSSLPDQSFDIAYATGAMYVPDLRRVYVESARVLRTHGLLTIGFVQPAIQCVAGDSTGYRICQPYHEKVHRREDGATEYRHYMDDVFSGLLDAGLSLSKVVDPARERRPDPEARTGTWTHESAYVGGYFIIVATKERASNRDGV